MVFEWPRVKLTVSLGAGDETLALFAKATEKHPGSEAIAQEAFLYYVKAGETRSAQQVCSSILLPSA